MELLLSALLGGVVATAISVLYNYYAERYRRRMEVMLDVVGWVDGTYVRLWDIQAHKELSYTKSKDVLTMEQYNAASTDLRARLLANEIPARVALVYGEGEELEMVNQLRGKMLEAARKLWKATQTTWKTDSSEILKLFEQEIDPLRQRLERRLLKGASKRLVGGSLHGRDTNQPAWKGVIE
jgi:hypothetical protein